MNFDDLKIEPYPPKNAGGQSVSIVSTGVKITHVPSELAAVCTIERSQSKNKKIALAMIEAGLDKINSL